eukprot:Skav215342  [mRNA]  locus=scaffold1391:296591:298915:- [translate_table: standard]
MFQCFRRGYMLQRYSAKLLLCIGLLVNSASTMAFGTLRNPTAMCLAKLLLLGLSCSCLIMGDASPATHVDLGIGFTESLQWVWAPLWIGKWATADSLPIWMNLSGSLAQYAVQCDTYGPMGVKIVKAMTRNGDGERDDKKSKRRGWSMVAMRAMVC